MLPREYGISAAFACREAGQEDLQILSGRSGGGILRCRGVESFRGLSICSCIRSVTR